MKIELWNHIDLTEADVRLLHRSVDLDPNQVPLKQHLANPNVMLLRIVDRDCYGFIIAVILQSPREKTFFVRHLAGRGLIKKIDELLEGLSELALQLECQSISCSVVRDGLVKLYKAKGFETQSVNMRLEV